jgi:hypothetical protein
MRSRATLDPDRRRQGVLCFVQGFQDIYNTVIAQLGALPDQVTPEQLIVNAIDSQTQSLSDILNQLDANGDGMISRQEAANTWLASLFNEIDVNGDGQITKLELIRFATSRHADERGQHERQRRDADEQHSEHDEQAF